MSDINWRPMAEFVGDEDTEYLLAIENRYPSGNVIVVYEVGNYGPIFTNDRWQNIEGWCLMDSKHDYDGPSWAITAGNTTRTVTHFAVINQP